MNSRNNKMELLGNAPISKALLAMGIPTMLGMMVNAIYNLVDAYFVGGLGTSQMGAISVVYPLGQIVVGLGLLFGNGSASYLSRLLGNRDQEQADRVASTALYSSVAVGAVLIIFSMIFLRPILRLLGATDSIMPYAMTYAGIYVVSCIFNVFNVTMNNIVTSEGAAKTTMFALMAGAVLNIGLDPVFIYTLDMGVAGAAIATAISQIVSTLIYLTFIFRKKSIYSFKMKNCTFTKEIMSEIFKIGIPTLVFQILTSLSISLVNTQAGPYGDSVIAGMGAVTRIVSMGSLIVFGFIKGFQPIAGYSYGAKKFDRLHKAIRTSILWSTVFCVIYGLLLTIFSSRIIAQFTDGDLEMIRVGTQSLRINGLSFLLFGFYTVYSSLFLALGKGLEGFVLGACRQGICFVPVILILPVFWGINGILYVQPIADVLSAIITIFMALHLHKELALAKQKFITL
ncbi:MATE family efflux transporter [Blautia sp. An249]|uniref:MATE family efflux transporter n=1 Tax=Blautia sp. An249 TaxID=1965603 RepID=UPI000B3AC031|nr:MATE family efflux transporter [Blautia sp. An249]OUO76379.1 MATE family efflux transporter [Blautia sp. An249]